MIRKNRNETSVNRCGGEGALNVQVLLEKEDLCGKGAGLTCITIPVGCSIGLHQHVGSCEQYCVLSGNGKFTANETVFPICAGESGIIKPNDFHAVRNTGDSDMIVIAAHIYC